MNPINFILPILTLLLGYYFGLKKEKPFIIVKSIGESNNKPFLTIKNIGKSAAKNIEIKPIRMPYERTIVGSFDSFKDKEFILKFSKTDILSPDGEALVKITAISEMDGVAFQKGIRLLILPLIDSGKLEIVFKDIWGMRHIGRSLIISGQITTI